MKRVFFLIIIFLQSFAVFAIKPPEVVLKSFHKKFPQALKIKWGKENAREWEAEFLIEKEKYSANFSLDGTWLETETEIVATQLPDIIASAIRKAFGKYKIVSASKIEKTNGEVLYEADLQHDLQKKEVVYKENGTLVK